jgi:hypothetical protein
MTKEVMQQAFDLIERLNKHGWILADFETEVYATLDSLKAALEQPPLPVQPVVWDKPSTNFNDWWDSDLRGNANPFTTDSFAYWAWEGWQAAQRPWVGLTNEDWEQIHDKKDTALDTFQQGAVWAADQLRERNT